MSWHRRFRNFLRRDRIDHDIEREIAFHIAETTDELVATGMNEDEARRSATRRFGNRGLQKERVRDVDLTQWLESAEQDVCLAARSLCRSPLFAIVVVLSLAFGIGSNVLPCSASLMRSSSGSWRS